MKKNLMWRNLATSLILYEKIQTTLAKAKVTQSVVEKNIQTAKRGFIQKQELVARRQLLGSLLDKKAVDKVFEVLRPRYQKLTSGFVEVIKLGNRLGDGSSMALVRLKNDAKDAKDIKAKNKDGEKDETKESKN